VSGCDAIVIGGGVNGLVAASCLARAGKRVVLLHAGGAQGGNSAQPLYALDPTIVADLQLTRHGLTFVARDMPLIGLRADGRHVVISRDVNATARNLAVHSQIDAEDWCRQRRDLWALARDLRSVWWDVGAVPPRRCEQLDRLQRLGAGAWLDFRFESEALKATLAWDAVAGSPFAAGSALLLVWRAAQEMCGLQGASAMPASNTFAGALSAAAEHAGVTVRANARVADLLMERGAVVGVRLDSGETLAAPLVFSTLPRGATLLRLAHGEGLDATERAALERTASRIGAADILLTLDAKPAFEGVPGNGRFVVAPNWESFAAAHASARAGRMPDEPVFEFVMPGKSAPLGDAMPAQAERYSIRIRMEPVPLFPVDGTDEKSLLAAKAIAALQRLMPDLLRHVVGVNVRAPGAIVEHDGCAEDAFDGNRLLADWRSRVSTPIAGLFLCGVSAEPASAVSGRAGRIAAQLALRGHL